MDRVSGGGCSRNSSQRTTVSGSLKHNIQSSQVFYREPQEPPVAQGFPFTLAQVEALKAFPNAPLLGERVRIDWLSGLNGALLW